MINTPSPLRYPGGKTILYEKIKQVLKNNNINEAIYIEPFAGGAGLALKLLFNGDVKNIIINDYDYAIYSFWHCILYNTEQFCEKVKNTNVTIEEWKRQKEIYNNQVEYTMNEVGFATFFLNRTNRSGIIKGGPIGGKNQEGKYKIDCRFNKDVLIKKIEKISSYKSKIKIFNYDVNKFIRYVINRQKSNNLFIYFDPPYINKGPELYKNHFRDMEHKELANNIKTKLIEKKWIITYDNVQKVNKLYKEFYRKEFNLRYSAGNNREGKEIMIFSNQLNTK